MGKEKELKKQSQDLQVKITEMQQLITQFQPEYDEKTAQLSQLNQQIIDCQKNSIEIKEQYRIEIQAQVELTMAEKKAEAEKAFEEASKIKEEAEVTYKEAIEKSNQIVDFEKEKKKEIATYVAEQKREAELYSKATKQDADNYLSDKQKEAAALLKDITNKRKALDSLEHSLREKEHGLASREIELISREEDAKYGFKTILRDERRKFDDELASIKVSIGELGKKLVEGKAAVDDQLRLYRETEIKKIDVDFQSRKSELSLAQQRLDEFKLQLDNKQNELNNKSFELKIQADAYKAKFSSIDDIVQEKLSDLHADVIRARDNYKKTCNDLSDKFGEEHEKVLTLTTKLNEGNGIEIGALQAEIKSLKEQLEECHSNENSIINKLREYKVDSSGLVSALYKISEYDKLLKKYEILNQDFEKLRIKNAESIHSEEALEMETKRANQYHQNYDSAVAELERMKKPSRKERLSSLIPLSNFENISSLPIFVKNSSELNWLRNISMKMKESGIVITDKLLYAFHTSVKIHDWSPIVVLAGVSGTGKSELPRQYAHHGGMNFIAVPVKPDWDSMQSLFGYYNSIENKFEPTELSRAIYSMKSDTLKNTVLMVLLDEMNLAYVELYFSDLLSKFETNRGTNDEIVYDINLGANEQPEKMVIGSNILWVGTMNEDETTKALSDKVIDRSTLLTFPRPRTLVSRRSDIKIAVAEKRMTFELWNTWCAETLTEDYVKSKIDITPYRKIIEDINDQMSKVNRNLGHRVWQSIEKYVFSHPLFIANFNNGTETKAQFNSAFAEAVAFKVMPKLRGIEVSGESKKTLESIGKIISGEIPSLEEDYKQAMNLSSRIFQWCSAKFMDIEAEKGE